MSFNTSAPISITLSSGVNIFIIGVAVRYNRAPVIVIIIKVMMTESISTSLKFFLSSFPTDIPMRVCVDPRSAYPGT